MKFITGISIMAGGISFLAGVLNSVITDDYSIRSFLETFFRYLGLVGLIIIAVGIIIFGLMIAFGDVQ